MKKELVILILLVVVLVSGCMEILEEEKELNELQISACEKADEAGTCKTRLVEVGIVTPEDCCEVLGKCC